MSSCVQTESHFCLSRRTRKLQDGFKQTRKLFFRERDMKINENGAKFLILFSSRQRETQRERGEGTSVSYRHRKRVETELRAIKCRREWFIGDQLINLIRFFSSSSLVVLCRTSDSSTCINVERSQVSRVNQSRKFPSESIRASAAARCDLHSSQVRPHLLHEEMLQGTYIVLLDTIVARDVIDREVERREQLVRGVQALVVIVGQRVQVVNVARVLLVVPAD
jgi:hypothetical protein